MLYGEFVLGPLGRPHIAPIARKVARDKISGGSGSVDIALRTDETSIACEISVTSTVRQEVGNVLKCLEAGFHEVAVLALKRPRLAKIQAALKDKLWSTPRRSG